MPTSPYQWLELAGCLAFVYIFFRPLCNYLTKIIEDP